MLNFQTEEDLLQHLARNIVERRRALGLTQAQVAERMEIDPESVSRLERGKNIPSLKTLLKLANALQISVAALLNEAPLTLDDELAPLSESLKPLSDFDRNFTLGIALKLGFHLSARGI